MDSSTEVLEIPLELRLVVLPCHPVDAGGGFAFERVERRPERVDVDMVEERGEPLLLPLLRGLPYAVQRLGHARPGLSPVRALLIPLPLVPALGSTASASGDPALFGGFMATMAESDFSDRASVTTAPRLPTADRQPSRAFGRPGDLPVPVQGACVRARFFDHAESPKRLR